MRVVALGGGHGLSASLAAARRYADDVTAVVSVADDGGSSGRLRKAFGIPAPGDLRKCLVALAADPPTVWARAFDHRFDDAAGGEFAGHPLGNIVIAGLAASTGDFEIALHEASRLVGVVGKVLPATREAIVLKTADVEGQAAVAQSGPIRDFQIVPEDASPAAGVVEAIEAADQIILGPGSLFTSVLAVVLVPAIRDALQRAAKDPDVQVVHVANLREQPGETAGMDLSDHVSTLRAHGCDPDVVLWDPAGGMPQGAPTTQRIEVRDLMRADGIAHDPAKLADALRDLVS